MPPPPQPSLNAGADTALRLLLPLCTAAPRPLSPHTVHILTGVLPDLRSVAATLTSAEASALVSESAEGKRGAGMRDVVDRMGTRMDVTGSAEIGSRAFVRDGGGGSGGNDGGCEENWIRGESAAVVSSDRERRLRLLVELLGYAEVARMVEFWAVDRGL